MIPSFLSKYSRPLVLSAALALGCADDDDGPAITGPDFPTGEGDLYPVQEVTFPTVDDVPVSASYVRSSNETRPVVILVHDLSDDFGRLEWLFTERFPRILEAGYHALAIDLRGHGETPLPNDGREFQGLTYSDLEDMHLEVKAAITWLRSQPTADKARIGVIGVGLGANVAFVSMGAFPEDLRVGVALSPGFWNQDLQPVVVGAGIEPFEPHSILYLVGSEDVLEVPNGQVFQLAQFASVLDAVTRDSSLRVFDGVSDHGLDLLYSPGAMQQILDWLGEHL